MAENRKPQRGRQRRAPQGPVLDDGPDGGREAIMARWEEDAAARQRELLRWSGAMMVDLEAGHHRLERLARLANRYLGETGLRPEDAHDAQHYLRAGVDGSFGGPRLYNVDQLPPAERRRFREVQRKFDAFRAVATNEQSNREHYLKTGERHVVRKPAQRALSEDELASIYYLVDTSNEETEAGLTASEVAVTDETRLGVVHLARCLNCGEFVLSSLEWLPDFKELHAEMDEFTRRVTVSDADREALARAMLVHPERGPQPTFYEWLAQHEPEYLETVDRHGLAVDLEITLSTIAMAADHVAEARRQQHEAEARAVEAEQREIEARKALEDERAASRRRVQPPLRQGTGYLASLLKTDVHVSDSRRRLAAHLTEDERAARKLFKYEPLGWAERLAITGLAAIARAEGLLDTHPSALQARATAQDQPVPRIRMAFPGVSELARVLGYEVGADGKAPRSARDALERALVSLVTKPRWIAEPVLVPVRRGKRLEWIKDTRVSQVLWVEASATDITRHTWLDLHPVAVASMLASWVTVGNLAARYEAAKLAIGRPQMRDEWAVADDYFRHRAIVKVGNVRAAARRQAIGDGASEEDAARAAGDAVGAMVLGTSPTVTVEVARTTLRRTLGLDAVAKKRGPRAAEEREQDSIAFAKAMGTVRSAVLRDGQEGAVWVLEVSHPDLGADAAAVLLLSGDAENESDGTSTASE